MSNSYIAMLFTSLMLAVVFGVITILLAEMSKGAPRLTAVVFAIFGTVALLLVLALPVIAVFGFIEGANQ
jgi:uncharacterized membrane protein YhaH (DUF805 family)